MQDANTDNPNAPEISPTHIEELTPTHVEEQQQQPQLKVLLRRSIKERRLMILDNYTVYLQKHEFDRRLEDDLVSFNQAKQCINSQKWIDVMKYEMKSIEDNDIWDLVEFPKGAKPICCR